MKRKTEENNDIKEIVGMLRKIQQDVKGLEDRLDAVERRLSGKPFINKASVDKENSGIGHIITRINEIEEKLDELKRREPIISIKNARSQNKNILYSIEFTGFFIGLLFVVFALLPGVSNLLLLISGVALIVFNMLKIYLLGKNERQKRNS